MAIIESVPNFSEGRRADVIQALVDAIQAPGVLLLDVSSDADHNRTVITVAGEPDAVLEGLFRVTALAAQTINLFEHRGEHPRIGATDVIPLVPVSGITLDECVTLAHALGRRIGAELGLPVYLYAAAAARPERKRLPDIRRGEFEGLLTSIHLPERAPDYGPAQIGPAGAVVVGARPFLIAYNIFLDTPNVEVAKAIAKQIRESSGGLPAVQAKGFLVEGQAQVSMNLLDTGLTPLHVVFDEVVRLAHQQGVGVTHSELIGLAPEQVMLAAAAHYLKLRGFRSTDTVEGAIQQAALRHKRLPPT
ncbi:MAG TPA: glutamate formimidoyltransferase [Chloroflexi bacterium]|nr:glutamate formimidoyltransferase [Chloroflexota bacterium]HHW89107.1 glutamate formimidoyltransferase [Chloroflexota bacterium]